MNTTLPKMSNIIFSILILTMLFGAYSAYGEQIYTTTKHNTDQTNGKISIEISLEKYEYSANKDIVINGTLFNTLNNNINIHSDMSKNLKIFISDGTTTEKVYTNFLINRTASDEDIAIIPSCGTYKFKYTIEREIHIFPDKTGEYKMHAIYKNTFPDFLDKAVWIGELHSNEISFKIVAP